MDVVVRAADRVEAFCLVRLDKITQVGHKPRTEITSYGGQSGHNCKKIRRSNATRRIYRDLLGMLPFS